MQQNIGNFLSNKIARKIHHFFFSFTLVLLMSVSSALSAGYTCNDIKMYTSCNAGYYMTVDGAYNGTATVGNACTICPAGYYCTGGTANKTACPGGTYGETTGLSTSACTASCPDFYTNSDPASTSMSSCYMNTTLGNYIATVNDTTETTCPADASYCPGNVRVYYGTTGGNITCPGNYDADTYEGKFSAIQCLIDCAAGYRVITPGGECVATTPGGWYMVKHTVGYGEVSPVDYCSNTFDNQSSTVYTKHRASSAACSSTVNAGNEGTLYTPHVYQLRLRNLSSTDTLWISYAYAGDDSTQLLKEGKETVDYEMLGTTAPIYNGRNTNSESIIARYGANPTLTDYAASVAPGGTITWTVYNNILGASVYVIRFGLTHENAMNGSLSTVSIPFAVEVLQPYYSEEWTTIYDTRTRSYADLSGVLGDGITIVMIDPMAQSPCDRGKYAGSSRTMVGGSNRYCTSASAGYYVPAKGAKAQTMCPAGEYTDTTGKSSCSTISAGYYSTGGGTSATPTAAGDGCISGQECGTIAAGYWGAAGATTAQGSGEVDGGYYSTGGGTSATPTENGNGCVGYGNTCGLTDENCYSNGTGGTSSCPQACSQFGFYDYSDKGSASHTACHGTLEPGYAVMEDSAAVVECPAGYACPGGETIYLEQSGGYTVCTDGQYQNETGQTTCKTCTSPAPYDTWLYTADILEPGTPHQFCAYHFIYGNADDPKMDEFISEFSNGMDLKTNPNYQPFNGGIIYGYAQYIPDNLDELTSIVSVPAYINPGYWYPQANDDDLSDEGQTYTSFQDMYEDTIVPVGSGYWSAGSTGFYKASTRNACPTGYDDGSATASAENQCVLNVTDGHYVGTAGQNSTNWGTCDAGYAKAAHSVSYGATSSCDPCTGATYQPDTGKSSCVTCPTATNNADHATSYGYWNSGATGDHTTVTGCHVEYTDNTLDNGTADSQLYCYADTDAATTGEYGVDGTSKGCWVYYSKLKCSEDYYNKNYTANGNYDFTYKTLAALQAGACTAVGTGYWSAADELTRTACTLAPDNASYTGSGGGTDNCPWACNSGYNLTSDGLCGQFCEAGITHIKLSTGLSIPLYSSKRTSHTLVVKTSAGDMCYASLASGNESGALNVNIDGTTYHAVD